MFEEFRVFLTSFWKLRRFCASVPGQAAKGWDGLEVAATVLQRPGVCRGPLRDGDF
jgi:hypothetical protein